MEQILEYRAALLERLDRQPTELADAVAEIPEAEWHVLCVADGTTIHQCVAHIRDLEVLAFVPRLRRVLAETDPELKSFPSHLWSADHYQTSEAMTDILAEFATAREAALQLMRPLTPETWSRLGFHPPSGRRTAQWWAERMYTHAREHLDAIRRAASA